MIKIQFIALFLVVFGTVFTVAQNSYAENKLEQLPEVEKLDAKSFDAQSRMVEQKYPEYAHFSFQMQIPNELRVIPQNELINKYEEDKITGTIFHAVGPINNAVRPYVKIDIHNLIRLISVKNWFINEIMRLGYTLKAIDGDVDRNDLDAFYVRLDDNGNTEVVRGRAFLNGDQVVLMEYVIPISLWNTDRDKQIMSAKSFRFIHEYDVFPPEPVQPYSYLDSFHTEYPQSWILQSSGSNQVNQIGLNFKTTDDVGFLLAEIDVDVLSSQSLRDRLDKTVYPVDLVGTLKDRRQTIINRGYDLDEHMSQKPIQLNFETVLNVTEVYPLRRKQSDTYITDREIPISKEYWVTLIRRPDDVGKHYMITMIAPYRENDMMQWAIAVEAYRHMIKSIR